MARKLPPIVGMDYVAIPGSNPDLSFGVVRRELKGRVFDTSKAVLKRLRPVGGAPRPNEEWVPTCYRADVLLPPGRGGSAQHGAGAVSCLRSPGLPRY